MYLEKDKLNNEIKSLTIEVKDKVLGINWYKEKLQETKKPIDSQREKEKAKL